MHFRELCCIIFHTWQMNLVMFSFYPAFTIHGIYVWCFSSVCFTRILSISQYHFHNILYWYVLCKHYQNNAWFWMSLSVYCVYCYELLHVIGSSQLHCTVILLDAGRYIANNWASIYDLYYRIAYLLVVNQLLASAASSWSAIIAMLIVCLSKTQFWHRRYSKNC